MYCDSDSEMGEEGKPLLRVWKDELLTDVSNVINLDTDSTRKRWLSYDPHMNFSAWQLGPSAIFPFLADSVMKAMVSSPSDRMPLLSEALGCPVWSPWTYPRIQLSPDHLDVLAIPWGLWVFQERAEKYLQGGGKWFVHRFKVSPMSWSFPSP